MTPPRRDRPTPGLVWPTPGVRTWVPPEKYLGRNCSGTGHCDTAGACQIGLTVTLSSGIYGCECPCHEPQRKRALKARQEERRTLRVS